MTGITAMGQNEYSILSVLARQVNCLLDAKATAQILDISLLGGSFGAACFLMEYGKIDSAFEKIGGEMLDKTFEIVPRYADVGTYCNGLSGFAAGLLLLKEDGLLEGVDEALDAIDPQIDNCLNIQLHNNDIDFLHGIIGYGFYFLRRVKSRLDYSKEGLSKIVGHLNEVKDVDGGKIMWNLGKPDIANRYNISLSHGMSSIVVLLSDILLSGVLYGKDAQITRNLLTGAVDFIKSQRVEKSGNFTPNLYPSTWLWSEDAPRYSRLAWCYGDLDVALALLKASEVLDDTALWHLSREIVLNSALRRDFEDTTLYDDCVCHGKTGVWLMMRYFYKHFNDIIIAQAVDYWRGCVISDFDANDDVACYKYFDPRKRQFKTDVGILEGLAGLGLALLPDKRFIDNVLLLY